ncbi:deoxyribonuclease IV [candidate division WOR-1 bacterium RIFOXYA12_FULL_43_27]|uniref:Probable endonuclease 4 n=1 Tax=candidate division WOR-1 bacterium RIFOXYC2_FULL_46_14 TaxID=1802587 RepID=A0A1F4U632_UNCSA|nr:MAG: deoxyribonuclease IV [candidate division WOR-1 bacterium RIFOXYA12_FULL_43_27]OGC20495.1 MAG: deoxyribonuclease IV [candidate division WOR-1 bacterium RIFOXYB2_FULL_46_45]OGC31768.1 MAG: deoxyribonuclease IV [candidate division WOR-1 bacterium RIFOXYA2_FULL_46_56]OGC40339.1 MAG: deoxyribonuclease IV [candidate division WOR-1 bacterium RIFOXYC2_FULL_46_14]
MKKILLGAHMSIAGGVDKAIDRGESIGCKTIQIFVKNNNQWFGKPLPEDEIERFKKLQKETGILVFAHTGYLVNLASPKENVYENSIKSMLDELERAEKLGIPFIVLHPGSSLDTPKEEGIKKIARTINGLFERINGYKTKIALETTAGQGSSVGSKFSEIEEIIRLVDDKKRIGVCFDTCHSFAAGYDIKTKEGYKNTWKEFDREIGIDKLLAFHINDSKKGLNSHLDRHEHIGKGELGLEPFRMILNDKRFDNIPMCLETPKGPELEEDIINLKILESLIKP